MPRSLTLLTIVLAVASVSCRDGTGIPAGVLGTYVLVQVDSSTVPAVLYEQPGWKYTVHADTLRLGFDSRATRVSVITAEPTDQASGGGAVVWRYDYGYQVAGEQLELTFICPPNALCARAEPLAATLTEDGLRITSGYIHLPLVYARVSRSP